MTVLDPFGVARPDLVRKQISPASQERARHYGRMAGITGTMAGTAGTVGAGSAAVHFAEKAGHDPMGFTAGKKTLAQADRMRILKPNIAAHAWQAKTLGAGALGAGALAAGYKYKQRKELAQPSLTSKAVGIQANPRQRRASDIALGTGAAGLGAASIAGGEQIAHGMNRSANEAFDVARRAQRRITGARAAGNPVSPANRAMRLAGARAVAVKKPAAAAALGIGALGGAGAYELGRHAVAAHELSKPRRP